MKGILIGEAHTNVLFGVCQYPWKIWFYRGRVKCYSLQNEFDDCFMKFILK